MNRKNDGLLPRTLEELMVGWEVSGVLDPKTNFKGGGAWRL